MKYVVLFGMLLMSQVSFAGDSAHGGDTHGLGEGAAWFVGRDRIISYCFELDENFGVTSKEVETELEESFKTWREYIERKLPRDEAPAKQIAIKSVLVPCSGKEDIRFLFGVMNDDVKKQVAHYHDPVGIPWFVKKKDKGFIWIAGPKKVTIEKVRAKEKSKTVLLDWHAPNALRGILLHEIGHAYGNDHVRWTIMDEAIVERVVKRPLEPKCTAGDPFLSSIDNQHELVTCVKCEKEASGQEWSGRLGWSEQTSKLNFQRLTGIQPTGKIRSRWTLDRKRSRHHEQLNNGKIVLVEETKRTLSLLIDDEAKSYQFPIESTTGGWTIKMPHTTPIFSVYVDDGTHMTSNYNSIQASQPVQLVNPYLKNRERVTVSYNDTDGAYTPNGPITVFWGDSREPLFAAGEAYDPQCVQDPVRDSYESLVSLPLLFR